MNTFVKIIRNGHMAPGKLADAELHFTGGELDGLRLIDIVLAESLDRFSRDQEDTAGLFKRLTFLGVRIITLAEGEITHLHVGFTGTMNALFLKDLADKTRRGLRGCVEAGRSGGGLCYGYRVVKSIAGTTITTGEREIEPSEAKRHLYESSDDPARRNRGVGFCMRCRRSCFAATSSKSFAMNSLAR